MLMTASLPEIESGGGWLLATAIQSMREGKATIAPGYNGVRHRSSTACGGSGRSVLANEMIGSTFE